MKICVDNELQHIKKELENRGYNVVNNINTPVDIIICDLKNGGLINLGSQGNFKREGTLIIDAGSKSIDEIEYIINNRSYSSLF
ncbi:Uncharacterised protein family (UPF0180) [Clostridium sp. USBA 49]|uniref:YkuS family protein n=1 Tax=Clostridium TaxID=1485 RepID=UPI00099AD31E|nr:MULTISPECIES: YkuS family protein [Clostridium]SKA91501.1 Uncharacterised protein family (UPF0180) [Clostridium sp. USBA 49]